MAYGRAVRNSTSTPFKTGNKLQRQAFQLQQKKAAQLEKRKARGARRKEEEKDPRLREERRTRNVPTTIDRKRVWDEAIGDEGDLGLSVDVQELKRRREEREAEQQDEWEDASSELDREAEAENSDEDEDLEDFLNGDEAEDDESSTTSKPASKPTSSEPERSERATSPSGTTTSTPLNLTPEGIANKFPTIVNPPAEPKILVTTNINGTVHDQARLLTSLFPNSTYIRRSAHYYAHKFSVREVSRFAANRGYTCVMVLEEWSKKPSGLTVVHLPEGPTFHFSISNWIPGAKIPDHGNPTGHHPELILNNFRTPLGLLTARLFKGFFPSQPELQGRQVVTMHNQRDYIFVRRHRYIFRDRRATEQSVVGTDGKPIKGVEDVRAGLQELGPRFTMKLRRIDKGIQRASGQEWEWKARSEKKRTRFQL